ncbi:MAG TPA: GntR family transcriptional regulator [Gemmatimonadales bacterium]|nr:GntR family transcriptional regulator [Gemmatimonadales bacterium]
MVVTRSPLGDQVYSEVVTLLHRGELLPGTRVRDSAIAERLGVSRTPAREALLRLSREGLLDAGPGRGFRVRPLDRAELRDVGAILAELEPLALRLSPDLAPDRLRRLDELVKQMEQSRGDAGRVIELDETWHQTLLDGCPNRRLLDLIASLRRVPRRYLHAYLREAGRLGLSTLHHTRLLAALRAGDRAGATGLLERRWRRGIEEMEAWIK